MKIIAINGSPKRDGATNWALEQCILAIKEQAPSMEVELISLGGKDLSGCTSCGYCRDNFSCNINDDFIEIQEKLKDPELKALILGSPVYMGGMTGQLKCFIDRSVIFRRNGFLFKDKIGGALTIGGSRNGGQDLVLQNIHAAMMIHDMIVVGDGYESSHFGGAGWAHTPEGMEKDETALATYRNLGKRIAQVAGKLG